MSTKSIWIVLAAAAGAFSATPASAQAYDPAFPVCLKLSEWGGGPTIMCHFTSLPQCNAAASGRPASCEANPFYAYANDPAKGPRRTRRR